MKIIITAGGLSKRFLDEGFNKPKYKIIVNNKSLLTWSLLSLKKMFNYEFILIFNKKNYDDSFVKSELDKLNIRKYKIVILNHITTGQATTALTADKYIGKDDSVIIYNIDTGIKPGILTQKIFKFDGLITTANAKGSHWSFVKIDKRGLAIATTEKIRISRYASIGAYYFKRWSDFKKVYNKWHQEIIAKYHEAYIAPMYQYLINDGKKIGIFNIKMKYIMNLGTPKEILKLDKNFKEKNI